MVDEADSKSVGGNVVWVQVPLPAVNKKEPIEFDGFFFYLSCMVPSATAILVFKYVGFAGFNM